MHMDSGPRSRPHEGSVLAGMPAPGPVTACPNSPICTAPPSLRASGRAGQGARQPPPAPVLREPEHPSSGQGRIVHNPALPMPWRVGLRTARPRGGEPGAALWPGETEGRGCHPGSPPRQPASRAGTSTHRPPRSGGGQGGARSRRTGGWRAPDGREGEGGGG